MPSWRRGLPAALIALSCAACEPPVEHDVTAPVIVVQAGERTPPSGLHAQAAAPAPTVAALQPPVPADDTPFSLAEQTTAREADLDRIDQVDPAALQAAMVGSAESADM